MGRQPESKLSRDIMDALRRRGAFVWKNHGGSTMMAGLPDIAGCWRGHFIAVETKMPAGGDPSPAQQLRHRQIADSGGVVVVARSVTEAVQKLTQALERRGVHVTPSDG